MAYETTHRRTGIQIPQTQSLVPRPGNGIVPVRRENDVGDEMGMAVQTFSRHTVVEFVTSEIPYDQRPVCDEKFNVKT